jgi:high-affinity nickel-transport protein
LALGFVLGLRHATDADHVVAVSAIVSRERSVLASAAIGAAWGLGHSLVLFVVGGALVLGSFAVPPRLGLAFEFVVALMLIALGVGNLSGAGGGPSWLHGTLHRLDVRHEHHEGVPVEGGRPPSALLASAGRGQALRSLVVGAVHGLAGSAAAALLVLSTVHDVAWGLVYLVVFGAGTIAGMAVMTGAFALPAAAAGPRFERWRGGVVRLAGALSLGFGLVLAWRIGVQDGLFTSHPTWSPY